MARQVLTNMRLNTVAEPKAKKVELTQEQKAEKEATLKSLINNFGSQLSKEVQEYLDGKQMQVIGKQKVKDNKGAFYSDVATKIMELRGRGESTKSAYKKALDTIKAIYVNQRGISVNFEFALMGYFLNMGLSVDKIVTYKDNLNKWRKDKLNINQILIEIKGK